MTIYLKKNEENEIFVTPSEFKKSVQKVVFSNSKAKQMSKTGLFSRSLRNNCTDSTFQAVPLPRQLLCRLQYSTLVISSGHARPHAAAQKAERSSRETFAC